MPPLQITCPEPIVHLIEDLRFVRPISGRRARRLVFAVSPSPWITSAAMTEAGVSLFLAS